MPELRKQQQAVQAGLQSLQAAASNHSQCLRLVETLADFRDRLRARVDTLEVTERQKILRLLVKEVLVDQDTITIRHSIRLPNAGPDPSGTFRPPHAPQPRPTPQPGPDYLLRSSRHHPALRYTLLPRRLQQQLEQPQHLSIADPSSHFFYHEVMPYRVKVRLAGRNR